MKTPAPLSNAIRSVANAAGRARRLPGQIFGDISWRPPRWLNRAGENWGRLERAYPRLIGALSLAARTPPQTFLEEEPVVMHVGEIVIR